MIGPTEIMLIFFVVLLIFGGRKIPELARGLGKAMGEFNKAKDDIGDSLKTDSPYPAEFAAKPDQDKKKDKSKDKKKKDKKKKSKDEKSKKDKKKKK